MAGPAVVVPYPHELHTSFVRGGLHGGTRTRTGEIPHIDDVLRVSHAPSVGWAGSRATVAAWVELSEAWVADGGEPIRLTHTIRTGAAATGMRAGWERWVEAGRPGPEDPRWRRGMRMAYVAPPDGTHHQWGAAVDFDVKALSADGFDRGSDEVLMKLWDMADAHGFSPVIGHPIADQSESWHLDHMGPLRLVYVELRSMYRNAYNEVARMGCALAGTLHDDTDNRMARYVQARLAIGGFVPGRCDGIIGPKTRASLKEAGAPPAVVDKARQNVPAVRAWLKASGIGSAEMESL